MTGLKPFFKFYGGKWRAAPHYPPPMQGLPIIEPFAGSAGYAMRHPHLPVHLYDVDPIIVGLWQYLIEVSADEILTLPDIEMGVDVRTLPIPQEAQWLIGFWLNSGSAQPKRTMSSGALIPRARSSYWGGHARLRIATQLEAIRHWTVDLRSYHDIDNEPATWFIDPPYVDAGNHYRYSNIDYPHLAEWCEDRLGFALVCEAATATWLPFKPLMDAQSFAKNRSAEGLWCQIKGDL